MRLPWRRRWTIAIVGRYSGTKTSLDGIYRFRRFSDALAKTIELDVKVPVDDVVGYEVVER